MKPTRGPLLLVLVMLAGTLGLAPAPRIGAEAGPSGAPIHWSFEDGLDGWTVEPGSTIDLPRSCREHLDFHPLRRNDEGACFLSTFPAGSPEGDLQAWYRGQFGDNNRGLTGQGPSSSWGSIVSPRFTLTRPTVSLLVAGGGSEDLYVAVCAVDPTVDSGCREVARVEGDDGEWFDYETLDLSDHLGEELFLRLVDHELRGWSHLALDDVRVNGPAMPRGVEAAQDADTATVSWQPVEEPDVIGYHLYRRRSDGESPWPAQWTEEEQAGFEKLTDSPLTATTFTDPGTDPDVAYWYRVAAVTSDGLVSEANLAYLRPALDPGLRERGEPREYSGERLSGVAYPVGPIGYGGVLHLGDGTRNLAWIFNIDGWVANSTWGRRDARVPNSFFAVRAQAPGGDPVVRALQTAEEGPFAPMSSLTFRAAEPVGTYDFADGDLPVHVRQHMESPTVPGDLRDSAIPTVIYTFEVSNPTDEPVAVSLLASQQNAIGYDGQTRSGDIGGPNRRTHSGYGQNHNELEVGPDAGHLHLTGCTEGDVVPVGLRCNGGLALSVLGPATSGTASWGSLEDLHAEFAATGIVSGPAVADSPEREVTVDGALTSTFELAPGETRSVPVVFSWYIPTSAPREFGGVGVEYANHWDSARGVQAEVLARLAELQRRNRVYRDALLDTNLPSYVVERLTSQIGTMRHPDGLHRPERVRGWVEGHGCCAGMPSHVWQYAQLAPRLWPEIDTRWQSQWLDNQMPDGTLPNRHHIPLFSFDGQSGVVLGSYRAFLSTGDRAWLARYWPRIRSAVDYLITHHDPDGTGSSPDPSR